MLTRICIPIFHSPHLNNGIKCDKICNTIKKIECFALLGSILFPYVLTNINSFRVFSLTVFSLTNISSHSQNYLIIEEEKECRRRRRRRRVDA
jgi:hypothetical protein